MNPAAERDRLAGVYGAKLTAQMAALRGGEEGRAGQVECFMREWLNLVLTYTWWKKFAANGE